MLKFSSAAKNIIINAVYENNNNEDIRLNNSWNDGKTEQVYLNY